YDRLPEEERPYWHPHNYEILSGELVAPGLPSIAENELMKKKINSYGKTFHVWRSNCWQGDKRYIDSLPLGPVYHAWSFNHD
ncbi:OBAP family protein, partial [Escherichia coli]|nr:OBAP family protein [Escherichia coli]